MSQTANQAEQKRRAWITLARIAVVVLMAYVLSIGPACAIFSGSAAHIPFYKPVFFVARLHPAIAQPLVWHLNAWTDRGRPLDAEDFRAVGWEVTMTKNTSPK